MAAVTTRLRIGTFVFNNDLRHPAVLAQDLASLDVTMLRERLGISSFMLGNIDDLVPVVERLAGT